MAVFEVYRGRIELGRHERNAGGTVGHGRSPHGAALPPVATMHGGRCATSPRLIFFGVDAFSTGRFMPLA